MSHKNLEEQAEEEKEEGEVIYLRSYSKAIFLFPLFITSIILWLLQYFLGTSGNPLPWLGFTWTLVFFINIIAIAFDISATKFFIIILIVIIVIVLLIFLVLPSTLYTIFHDVDYIEFNIGMSKNFYMVMTIILGIILLVTLIIPLFNYWKLERNEITHRKGIFVEADRYPTKSLRYKKKIPDVIEFFLMGAGSITLFLGRNDTEHLKTILAINNKARRIDSLLSEFEVEVEPDYN